MENSGARQNKAVGRKRNTVQFWSWTATGLSFLALFGLSGLLVKERPSTVSGATVQTTPSGSDTGGGLGTSGSSGGSFSSTPLPSFGSSGPSGGNSGSFDFSSGAS